MHAAAREEEKSARCYTGGGWSRTALTLWVAVSARVVDQGHPSTSVLGLVRVRSLPSAATETHAFFSPTLSLFLVVSFLSVASWSPEAAGPLGAVGPRGQSQRPWAGRMSLVTRKTRRKTHAPMANGHLKKGEKKSGTRQTRDSFLLAIRPSAALRGKGKKDDEQKKATGTLAGTESRLDKPGARVKKRNKAILRSSMQDPLLCIARLAVREAPRRRPRPSDFNAVGLGGDYEARARTRRRLGGDAPRWKRKRADDILPLQDNGYACPRGPTILFFPRVPSVGSPFFLWRALNPGPEPCVALLYIYI